MTISAALAGIVSQIPIIDRIADRVIYQYRLDGGTVSAQYCYSVWLRHLAYARKHGLPAQVEAIAEIGPGRTIGTGIAALISGVTDKYYAMDVVDNDPSENNLRLFDELVTMFQQRLPIPDDTAYPKLKPRLDSYAFPSHILTETHLAQALDPARLEAIREALTHLPGTGSIQIYYTAPWYDPSILKPASVDWILSQAVLEHVDELDQTYQAFHDWLKPEGLMTHEIDFKAHNTAARWNGHWTYSEFVWKRIFRGKRVYLINRQPLSTHRTLLSQYGFNCLEVIPETTPSAIQQQELAANFQHFTDEDLNSSTAFMVARRAT